MKRILMYFIIMIFVLAQAQRSVAQNSTTLPDLQKTHSSTNEFSVQAMDTLIQFLINQTNLDTLVHFVNILSGEDSVTINDTSYLFLSRYLYHPHNDLAADFIFQTLNRFNLTTYSHIYSSTGRNILGVKTGTDFPDQKFIICAHYDDMPPQPPAPGADDNASSVAAVLESARLLSQIPTPYTIIFALWDEEEMGCWGSRNYALQAYLSGEDILGVVNLEMLGYDSDNDGLFDIHTQPISNSVELANLVDSLQIHYNLGLTSVIYNPGTTASDHSSFWNQGYSAIVFIEAFFSGDPNPFYHTSNDKIENFNLNYYHALSKLAVATITHLAFYNVIPVDVRNETNAIALDFVLHQNYPNPFNPVTNIQYAVSSRQFVKLTVYDVLGNEVATLVNEEKPIGTYEVEFSIYSGEGRNLPAGRQGLSSGVYFYRLRAGTFIATKKMLLLK